MRRAIRFVVGDFMFSQKCAISPLTGALAIALCSPAFAAPAPLQATDLDAVQVHAPRFDGYATGKTRTATKTDTLLLDVPQAVTVVSQQQIKDLAIQGMADAVRYVPGIGVTQGEGNRDGLVFRGNSSTADLFIDGMRDDTQYFRDVYNIDRIEAFKGPNAMIFGRGSPGGLLNRITKVADWNIAREIGMQVGSWDKKRLTADVNQSINDAVAFRVTGVFEDSKGFRDGFKLERQGINPTLALRSGESTLVTLGYEYFHDARTADRGIPSYPNAFDGTRHPVDTDRKTFFGDAAASRSRVDVNAFNSLVEHDFGGGTVLRNRTRYADYDKFYQNVFSEKLNAAATTVELKAYNNLTQRQNLFNQTDLTFSAATGAISHKFLVGAEFGRQETDNLRRSGSFLSPAQAPCLTGSADGKTCIVSLDNPSVSVPISYANSASDTNQAVVTRIAAVYLQDQIVFSPQWEAVVGLRYDRFDVDLQDLRASTAPANRDLSSSDGLLSPRVGLIYKPVENVSLYTSYGITYLPRSGEQMTSLLPTTQALEPEEFENVEVGAKWDITPKLSANAAVYRLNRSNVAVVDPANPTQMILFSGDSQRSEGVELSLSGQLTEAWQIIASYAYQEAEITRDIRTSATSVTPKGTDLAQTPRQAIGVWNRYDFSPNWGVGLGASYRGSSFASISNAVTLKSHTRYDGAIYYTINDNINLQLNVENLFDKRYYASSHSDNNITPGSPRAVYVSANVSF